ncbi:MAG TPA: 1,4-alpha-glucan branching enzyme [Lachnospiraceae bacterium]|nr:1,4-alpha-glucan branching enzyme [Lachnospiraceae bacterium]
MNILNFFSGDCFDAYKYFGVHKYWKMGEEGYIFRVYAPNAEAVDIICDKSDWKPVNMYKDKGGIFSLFMTEAEEGMRYKYRIHQQNGEITDRADPYGFKSELRPDNASVVIRLDNFEFTDVTWMRNRSQNYNFPMNIYELHFGSWKMKPHNEDEPEKGWYKYSEIAGELIKYLKDNYFTHVEILPLAEHPFDGSWGYQVTGYFAPTSRFGTPDDFKKMINQFHKAGIGVILDWVPAHFPKDEHGLGRFDGTCLYEHLDKRQGEHPHWGTLIYNYGRPQVANYLIANALFWLEQYHADGLRLDAVASMLYLDYGKQDGEWIANMYGGNENLEAIEFLKKLNQKIKDRRDGSLSIAEESTAWPMVTGNVEEGGLGFDFKWNMGWMNDYLEYIKTDPLFRKGRHGMITFSMVYQYSENFMLVFSHDEVVHMKGSMYQKMPGTPAQKLAGLRQSFGYMAAHPGKKLLFMGQDFGQISEWSEERGLDWNLLADGKAMASGTGEVIQVKSSHRMLQDFVADLWKFYKAHPAMYAWDEIPDGFEWVSMLDADHSVIAFMREAENEKLLVVCNFTPVCYPEFKLGVPYAGKYKEILNSDAIVYGGENHTNPRLKNSKKEKMDGMEQSITFTLAPTAIQIFSYQPEQPVNRKRKKK